MKTLNSGALIKDLPDLDSWEEFNLKVQKLLIDDLIKVSVRCYTSLAEAIYEIAFGLSQVMSHKKSVAILTGGSPLFLHFSGLYLREGYKVESTARSVVSDWKAYVESLSKDTLFVMMAEDHVIADELFDCSELEKLLAEKRIYLIKVRHSFCFEKKIDQPPSAFTISISSVSDELSVAVLGQRYKAPPVIAHLSSKLKESHLNELEKAMNNESPIDKKAIIEFEQKVIDSGAQVYNSHESSRRRYDRSLIRFPGVNAAGVVELAQRDLPEVKNQIASLSACQFPSLQNFQDWWPEGPSESARHEILILSVTTLRHPNILSLLKKWSENCDLVI